MIEEQKVRCLFCAEVGHREEECPHLDAGMQEKCLGQDERESICGATIAFADDHQDNSCTFMCNLTIGHEGLHEQSGVFPFPTVVDMLGGIVFQHWVLRWEDPLQEERG